VVYVSDFVGLLLKQAGDEYVYGVSAADSDADPRAFDCSELIRWGATRLGVVPAVPDGSWMQVQHCRRHGLLTAVDDAVRTQGALLFLFVGDPFRAQRPSTAHVAVSLGNGSTIEARGKKWGVGSWTATGRGWTHGGRVPGIRYVQPPGAPAASPSAAPAPPWPGRFYNQPPVMSGEGVRRWQAQMAARGWPIGVDGRYGPESEEVCRRFQAEVGLQVDGIVGGTTWAAAWTAPVLSYPGRRG